MSDCVFCRIVNRELPATVVFEDDQTVAFKDINPLAPVHILVIPKRHLPDLGAVVAIEQGESLLGRLLSVAVQVAGLAGLGRGYRVVINSGPEGGQAVDHVHIHVLGGRQMTWPPG